MRSQSDLERLTISTVVDMNTLHTLQSVRSPYSERPCWNLTNTSMIYSAINVGTEREGLSIDVPHTVVRLLHVL